MDGADGERRVDVVGQGILDRLRHGIGRSHVLAAQRAVPAIERRLGLDQALVREVERLAVVRRQQQQSDRLAGILVQELVHGEEVAERLAHLLAGDVQKAVVHPVPRHDGMTERAAALRDLVLVMREDEIETAGVDVEGLAQELAAHGRALDVPARPAATPRARPARLLRRRGLPQHEVGGILLVGRDVDAAPPPARRACGATGDRSRSCSAR